MRAVVKAYAIVVVATLAFAWYADISLRNSGREHLLGDMLLALVSMPLSLSLGFFYDHWTALANRPLAQLTWLSGCAAIQVVALHAVDRAMTTLKISESEPWRRFWS